MKVVDERMRAYYDRRASEYDDWWLGTGLFEKRNRPGWSRRRVYKRFFTAPDLASELGGGTVLHDGHWFVVVASGAAV